MPLQQYIISLNSESELDQNVLLKSMFLLINKWRNVTILRIVNLVANIYDFKKGGVAPNPTYKPNHLVLYCTNKIGQIHTN